MSIEDDGWLLAQLPALVYVRALDAPWTLHRLEGAGAALLGRASDDLGLGSSLLAAIDPDDRVRVERELACAGAEVALEYRVISAASDEPRWVLDRGRRVGAQLVGVIVGLSPGDAARAARRSEIDARLWEAQKLEAVARLAGGVAQDFNNMLTGIIGNAALVRAKLPTGSEVVATVRLIEEAAERSAHLTQQLLAFARRGKAQAVVFDVATVVDDAAALLRRSLDTSVTLTLDPPAAVAVSGDAAQIQGVVLNLAINARDALVAGGTITLSVRREEVDDLFVAKHPGLVRGSHAVISVSDDGPGVSENLRELIFEPFFTTKPQGTGMGLSMAYGIVRSHGGLIVLEGAAGRGACFSVYLPMVKARRISDPFEQLPLPSPRVRILLVDDEEFVRYAVRAQLEALGHEVLLAKDGHEAVALYGEARATVDLVILDLTMPRMDGGACFQALRALEPGVKAILASGYGRDGAVQAVLDQGVQGFLEKPFRQSELAAEIARVLALSFGN